MKKRKVKVVRKIETKASLKAQIENLVKQLAWGTDIIKAQQGEIDRMTALNTKLTNILDQFSRKE